MKTRLNNLHILLSLVMMLLIIQGCRKDDYSTTSQDTPESIFDLKVSPSFNWKTSEDIVIKVTGLRLPATIKNTLYVRSLDGSITYYNDLLEMDKDYTIGLSVPSYVEELVISYGTISKTVEIKGNTIDFNYSVHQ